MALYKHYSFDLWMTLIRSNPLFKQRRATFFHQHYNRLGKPLAEVEAAFRKVDLMVNAINEHTGKNIDAEEMYLMVICLLNQDEPQLHDIDMGGLYLQMEELVFEHCPVLYSNETRDVLATLAEGGERTINILSNTGFIKGSTLRRVLAQLQIDTYFNFQLYSDEAGLSKPAPGFFNMMIEEARVKNSNLAPGDIIHIGDNPNADINGARQAGVAGLLVNSNNISISQLLSYATGNVLTS